MNMDDEKRYEHTLEQIIFQLENLMMEILLAGIKRLNIDYEQVVMKLTNPEKPDDMKF
jgi:hypothetical protein